MEKNIDTKTKYRYVMRYLNGESPTKMGLEINPQLKELADPIFRWNSIYQKEGIKGLEPKTEKKKSSNKGRTKMKPKPKYEDMSKEGLIERLKINDVFIDEINKSIRARFKYR